MDFKSTVYNIVSKIPKGKVMTYKQVATLSGNPNASRAVGLFMSKNNNPEKIPCHRVVSSDGSLTGYAFGEGVKTKKEILLNEGVIFNKDKVDLTESKLLLK